jgi:hypothetical protein
MEAMIVETGAEANRPPVLLDGIRLDREKLGPAA